MSQRARRKRSRPEPLDQPDLFSIAPAPVRPAPAATAEQEAPQPRKTEARVSDVAASEKKPPRQKPERTSKKNTKNNMRRAARSPDEAPPAPMRRYTPEEAAEMLAVSMKTLEAWRRLGKGPRFIKLGRAVRYALDDLEEFSRERTVSNSAEGRMLDAQR
jgi:hypothetical protein